MGSFCETVLRGAIRDICRSGMRRVLRIQDVYVQRQEEMIGLVYIFGGVCLFIAVGAAIDRLKLRRLRRQRQGGHFTRQQFVEAFRSLGISEQIPGTVSLLCARL